MIRRSAAVFFAAFLVLVSLGGASAGASEETGLAQTRAEKARKQVELEAARATDEQLESRLAQLKVEIASQSQRAEESKKAAAIAEEASRLAEARLKRTVSEFESQKIVFASRVRAAYKLPNAGVLEALVESSSISEAGLRLYGLSKVIESNQEVISRLEALRRDFEEDRQAFEVERQRAESAREKAEEQVARLAELHASTEATERALKDRIEELKSEIEALAREEARIQSLIRARQAAAEAALEKRRASSSSAGSRSGGSSALPSDRGFVWPVGGVVTSGFGMRWGRLHAGIDIAAAMGSPVRAAQSGQVIFAGSQGGYGNLVLVAHGGGIVTAYAHLSSIGVSQGQFVERGQTIGAVGSTGHSTGPHLHFEVRVNGSPVDPMGYL